MQTLKSQTLHWDVDGHAVDQEIQIGPAQTVVQALGNITTDLVNAKPIAQTDAAYMANPAAFDWLGADLLRVPPPGRWFDPLLPDEEDPHHAPGSYVYLTSLPEQTTAAWFKMNRQQASRWWKEHYGVDFDTLVPKLGPMQRKKTGIA